VIGVRRGAARKTSGWIGSGSEATRDFIRWPAAGLGTKGPQDTLDGPMAWPCLGENFREHGSNSNADNAISFVRSSKAGVAVVVVVAAAGRRRRLQQLQQLQ